MLMLTELFTNENIKCLKNLGIFVDKAFELKKIWDWYDASDITLI